MYMLRSPITKISICKIIPPSRINLNFPIVCPLCRLSRISSTVQTYRLQSTSTKTSVVRLQLKKKKKKTKIGEYSELIQVAETTGKHVKEKRAVIKKSSTTEILKGLGATDLKNLHKQVLGAAASSNVANVNVNANLLKRNNDPESVATPTSPGSSKPSSRASTLIHINATSGKDATKTAKQSCKKISSFQNDLAAESQQSLQLKSAKTSSKICDQNGAISVKLDDVAVVDDFTMDHSYYLENIRIPRSEPFCQNINYESSVSIPNLGLDIEEMDEVYRIAKSKKKELTENKRLSNKQKALKPHEQENVFKLKTEELEKSGKDLHLNLSLRSFLDVCINSDMLNLAHSTLMCYRSKGRNLKDGLKLTDVRLFNIVLSGYAQKGNWSKLRDVIAALRDDDIKPNLQTYAACLECISRQTAPDKKIVRQVLQDAEKYGLDIAKLDHECTYINDQRERVIKMVRLVYPDFQPTLRENLRHYSCNLLSRLNEEPSQNRFYDPSGGAVTYEQLRTSLRHQMEMEVSNKVAVHSIEKLAYNMDENFIKTRSILHEYKEHWRAVLHQAFEENLRLLKIHQGAKYGRSVTLHPFLMALDAKVYVDIMLQEIRLLAESSETFSHALSTLHFTIGSKVMNSYMIATKQKHGLVDKIETLYRTYCEYYVNPNLTSQYTPREYWQKLINENMEGPTIDVDDKSWPGHLIVCVGKFLYDMIIQEVKINTNVLKSEDTQGWQFPAFYSIYRNNGIFVKEEIKPHPLLVHMYQIEMKDKLTFEGTVVPALVPPLPWTSIRSGGYLLSSAKIIRLPDAACHQKLKLEQTPNQQLFPIYDSLNQLGECPWKINKPILDIIIEVFNNKGDEALDIPPPSSECPTLPSVTSDMNREEKAKAYKERTLLKRKRAEMHSLRCDGLYKLSIANHFRDKIFWFPHNIDFRGRVYPCPPHFNHLGGDMSRSILLFAKGEPLGENGLNWLKIHLINLTGLKKQDAISNRLEYANKMMPEIIDSANNPLNGRRWWTKSEEPWQTLACCKEIINAVCSPDPKKYICHFPIHQDGSCNGLQHYAALGRDGHGAKQVNLYPMDKPQDVYTGVANLVERERAKDAKNGVKIAEVLEGFIKRKVIKQTVMTTVYGVTRFGARLQIYKQLKDLPDFPEDQTWAASMYLTQKTFQSLQEMFTATKEIQDWFTEIAKLVAKVCGQPLEWVTPLGLPIIQPYHRPAKTTMSLGLSNKRQIGRHFKMDIFLRPNVMKQRNAFPPNFVHSLDSTHMMLTSLFCQREGITFVSVHDCYWTHPSKNVTKMNTICREQFVALHSEPILENLSKCLTQKYSYHENEFENDGSVTDLAKRRLNKLILRVPATGNFDLRNVLTSTYFFS